MVPAIPATFSTASSLIDYLLDTINPASGRTAVDGVVALNRIIHPDQPTYFDDVVRPLQEQGYDTTIQLAYFAYLRRPPQQLADPAVTDEYDRWFNQLRQTNGDMAFFVQSLASHPEFLQPYVNMDLAGGIADLIRFLFGRPATPEEVNFWLTRANQDGIWLP